MSICRTLCVTAFINRDVIRVVSLRFVTGEQLMPSRGCSALSYQGHIIMAQPLFSYYFHLSFERIYADIIGYKIKNGKGITFVNKLNNISLVNTVTMKLHGLLCSLNC